MKLGFTGTRGLLESDYVSLDAFLEEETTLYSEFTTGACIGTDAYIARWLVKRYPNATHRLVVPANRSYVDAGLIGEFVAAYVPGYMCIEFMPSTTDYRDRNARIVQYSDKLAGVVEHDEKDGRSQRSGTWQTLRLALNQRIPVAVKRLERA